MRTVAARSAFSQVATGAIGLATLN